MTTSPDPPGASTDSLPTATRSSKVSTVASTVTAGARKYSESHGCRDDERDVEQREQDHQDGAGDPGDRTDEHRHQRYLDAEPEEVRQREDEDADDGVDDERLDVLEDPVADDYRDDRERQETDLDECDHYVIVPRTGYRLCGAETGHEQPVTATCRLFSADIVILPAVTS